MNQNKQHENPLCSSFIPDNDETSLSACITTAEINTCAERYVTARVPVVPEIGPNGNPAPELQKE